MKKKKFTSEKLKKLITTGCDGMARDQKRDMPPYQHSNEFVIPKALVPFMNAFRVNLESDVQSLIKEAIIAILGDHPYGLDISNEELEGVVALMKEINPRDSLEIFYAAQIVSSYMLGMRELSASYPEDQKLGLKLLEFSNESMQRLMERRCCSKKISH